MYLPKFAKYKIKNNLFAGDHINKNIVKVGFILDNKDSHEKECKMCLTNFLIELNKSFFDLLKTEINYSSIEHIKFELFSLEFEKSLDSNILEKATFDVLNNKTQHFNLSFMNYLNNSKFNVKMDKNFCIIQKDKNLEDFINVFSKYCKYLILESYIKLYKSIKNINPCQISDNVKIIKNNDKIVIVDINKIITKIKKQKDTILLTENLQNENTKKNSSFISKLEEYAKPEKLLKELNDKIKKIIKKTEDKIIFSEFGKIYFEFDNTYNYTNLKILKEEFDDKKKIEDLILTTEKTYQANKIENDKKCYNDL